MGRAQFDPSLIGSIFWHFSVKFTHFWSKNEVMEIVCNGQSSENRFFKNQWFLINFWWKSSKKGSKIDFWPQNCVFPGGTPGNRENRKFVMGRAQEKIVKLPKVYGFLRFFTIFHEFSWFSWFFMIFNDFWPHFC